MSFGRFTSRRAALSASISMLSLMLATGAALAQSTDAGSVDVQAGRGLPPIQSRAAVGSQAPAQSAPALAPVQSTLDAIEPTSIVSDKVIRDIAQPTSDYNEIVKYTPGWAGSNPNGLLGDSKGGWRGLANGQYNITFDGIPFGDENNPTQHSAAYFPAGFLSSIVVDRGPGPASQFGYASFGGTMALNSTQLSDTFGGSISGSIGSYNTQNTTITLQTGKIAGSEARALIQYSNSLTYGAEQFGKVYQNQFLGKAQDKFGDFTVTVLMTYGTENYTNLASGITYQQLQTYGKRYGAINANPLTQEFVGYNNSQKRTDMSYIDIDGSLHGLHFDNKLYTYAYDYPALQNNSTSQTIEGPMSLTNNPLINSHCTANPKICNTGTAANGNKFYVPITGVAATDVVGYVKYNNYRAFGDTFKIDTFVDAGFASGLLRTGLWWEHGSNARLQENYDYTTGMALPALGNSLQASYKLDLTSNTTTVQPFVEYEWSPMPGLTITPGFKYEMFTRNIDALVNQTTLQPLTYTHTYTSSQPFLAANYRVTDELSVYAQASQGFLVPDVSAYYVWNPAVASIKPQTTDNLQAGAVFKNERITADIDVYRVKAYNYDSVTTVNGLSYYVNGGAVQFQGIEAEGTYAFSHGWSAYASAAVLSAASTVAPHLRVADAPRFTTAFGVVFDNGKYFGSALERIVGDYYGSSGQSAPKAGVDTTLNHVKGFDTTDLVIGVRGRELQDFGYLRNATFKLGVSNLFDVRDTAEIGGSPATTSPATAGLTYSFFSGRTIYGTVTMSF